MTWDIETCYYEYQEASTYLLKSLGIVQLDHVKNREVLYPYYLQIIKYINRELMCNTEDNIKAKIEKIVEIADYGSTKICTELALELAEEIGVEIESPNYDQDRFVFSWADLLGTLILRLKFQYAYLFKQEYDDSCGCKCGKGETEEEYESWVSGVYPEDYEYDRTNYYRTNTNWGTEEDRICDCYKTN